jgi:AraC-like DNA-binding protein
MEQTQAVIKMQEFIKHNSDGEITMRDLADVCGYSPWHAYRLFSRLTGFSPAEYIRKLRLSESALRLRDAKVKVLDVALDAGYSTAESYLRAFRSEFGMNPSEYTKCPVPIRIFHPYPVEFKNKEKKQMSEVKSVFITQIEKPARKVIIKRGKSADNYMDYCGEVGCNVWETLLSIKGIGNEPVCLWLPQKFIKPGTSKYVQGVEVLADYNGMIPEGYDSIDLPAAKYLMFQGEPFDDADYEEAIGALREAEKKYNPSSIGMSWDESNPKVQLEPQGERGYIELLAVK